MSQQFYFIPHRPATKGQLEIKGYGLDDSPKTNHKMKIQ